MTKITIFYGPKIEFDKVIMEFEVTTLSKVVRDIDSKRNHLVVSKDEFEPIDRKFEVKSLVVHSDEYMSVNEHVILNFDGFISSYIISESIFLHNPPVQLKEKMEKIYNDVDIIFYQYKKFDLSVLRTMYHNFDTVVVGQERVRKKLFSSFMPHSRGVSKPIIIMFYGPSGVGKTETAKYLAQNMEGELFRRQCSMFQNNEFLTYLFGGKYNEKCFAKELLERDSNIILLDEFDKAPSVFHSAFYQFFDEGLFEDKNYSVKLDGAIVVCTSNYTSLKEIRDALGDPIFSRFNMCISFDELNQEAIIEIITRIVEEEFRKLTEEEKLLIDPEDVSALMISKSKMLKNVRNIRNLIKEVIDIKVFESTVING